MRFLTIVRGDARPAAEWRMVGGPPDPRSPVRRTTSDKVDMVGEFFWKLCGGGARAGISRPCQAGIQLAAGESKYINTPGLLVGHVTPTLEFPEQGQTDINRLGYVGPKFWSLARERL